jgi:hypothetical protein
MNEEDILEEGTPTKEEVAAIAQSLIDARVLTPAWMGKLEAEGANYPELAKELEGKAI